MFHQDIISLTDKSDEEPSTSEINKYVNKKSNLHHNFLTTFDFHSHIIISKVFLAFFVYFQPFFSYDDDSLEGKYQEDEAVEDEPSSQHTNDSEHV